MSFNQPHINITRANYEEAFLLYMDGELSKEGMAAVEAFVLLHPDLQDELDLLLTTKLDAEVLVLEGKESLLAQNMKADVTEENLLFYIDGELSQKEQLEVERRLAADKDFSLQYQLLMSAKLPLDETLVYTNKAELYRQTEKRMQPRAWMRIAAAIVILLGIGILWTGSGVDKGENIPLIVQVPGKKIEQPTVNPEKIQLEQPTQDLALQDPVLQKKEKESPLKTSDKKQTIVLQSPLPAPDERDRVIALHQSLGDKVSVPKNVTEQGLVQQQTINNGSVTTTITPAYTTVDEAAKTETGFSNAVALSNDDKKGSVRGFLRKASRFIERRTGINPVNEDDELMIGVVALKLK